MDAIYRLYSNNYFGIGLLMVIAILAFSFLVILFFGKKDEKKRKQEKLEQSNNEISTNTEVVKEENNEVIEEHIEENDLQPISITDTENEIPKLEEPVIVEPSITPIDIPTVEEQTEFIETPVEEMDDFVTKNLVLNTDYINEDNTLADNIEVTNTSSDIYNLDSIINESNEESNLTPEESIDEVLNKYDISTPVENNSEDHQEEYNFIPIEEAVQDTPKEPEVMEPRKTSTPFSSVYLTKEEANAKEESIMPVEEKAEKPTATTFQRPTFDLPKRVDLPKRNNSVINEGMIDTETIKNHTSNIFDNIEQDTYTIDR